ncbi:MAG: hypothetical protein ACYTEQ_01845 [Planctomycetota bacterium]
MQRDVYTNFMATLAGKPSPSKGMGRRSLAPTVRKELPTATDKKRHEAKADERWRAQYAREREQEIRRMARKKGYTREQAEEMWKSGEVDETVAPHEMALYVYGGGTIPAAMRAGLGKMSSKQLAHVLKAKAIPALTAGAAEPLYQIAGEEAADRFGPNAGLAAEIAAGVGGALTVERALEKRLINKVLNRDLAGALEGALKASSKGAPKVARLRDIAHAVPEKYGATATDTAVVAKARKAGWTKGSTLREMEKVEKERRVTERLKEKAQAAAAEGKSPSEAFTPYERGLIAKHAKSSRAGDIAENQKHMQPDMTTMSPHKVVNDVDVDTIARLRVAGRHAEADMHMHKLSATVDVNDVAHNVQALESKYRRELAGDVAAGGLQYGSSLKHLLRGGRLIDGIDNFNATRYEGDYDVKHFMFSASTTAKKQMDEAAQAGKNWEDSKEGADWLADTLGVSTGRLIRGLKQRTDDLDSYVLAARDVLSKSAHDMMDAFKEVAAAPPEAKGALIKRVQELWTMHAEIQAEVLGAGSKIGRALNVHKRMATPDSRFGYVVNTLHDKGFTEDMIQSLSELKPTDIDAINKLVRDSVKSNFVDRFWGYYYNNILSAPPTHAINTLSNTMWQAFQQFAVRPGRAVADLGISKMTGKEQEYFVREIIPSYVAGVKGIGEGIRKGLEIMKHGMNEESSKLMREFFGGAQSLSGNAVNNPKSVRFAKLSPFTYSPHAWQRKAAPLLEAPTRFLAASDMFFKTIAFESEKYAWATRKALQGRTTSFLSGKGSKALSQMGLQKRFKSLAAEVEELVADSNPEMIDRATKFAQKMTYTDDPGPFVSYILRGRNVPVVGSMFRLLMPFISTPANLLKRGAEMTPGLGVLSKTADKWAETGTLAGGIKKLGSQEELSDMLIHQLYGSAIGAYMINKYYNGELTADAPMDASEKALFYKDKLPWAMKVGDTWYQYRRLEPFNTVMSAAASLGEALKSGDDTTNAEKLGKFGIAMGKNLMDASYFSQMSDLIAAFDRGTRGSESILNNMASRTLSGFVPAAGAMRTASRALESERHGGALIRQPRTAADYLKANIPFASESVPHRVDEFGQPIKIPGGAVRQSFPIKYKEAVKDELTQAIIDAQWKKGKPSDKFKFRGETYKMDEELFKQYREEFGAEAERRMRRVVASAAFKRMTPEQQKKRLDRIYESAKKRHRGKAQRKTIRGQ